MYVKNRGLSKLAVGESLRQTEPALTRKSYSFL